MTRVSGCRSRHWCQDMRSEGSRFSRVPLRGPAIAQPSCRQRLTVDRSYMTSAPCRRMPVTPKRRSGWVRRARSANTPVESRESYTMLAGTIGHQVTVMGPPRNESFTTSRPCRNITG